MILSSKTLRISSFLFPIFLVMLFAASCNNTVKVKETRNLMGTFVEITVLSNGEENGRKAIAGAFGKIEEINNLMSVYIEKSIISKINRNAGIAPVNTSESVLDIIEKSKIYSRLTGGRFDITVSPLINLWREYIKRSSLPPESEIARVREKVDYNKVNVSYANLTVFLEKKGMSLDLGAIAKGYAVDEAAKYLMLSQGIRSALINAGGDILAKGWNYDGRPWRVGVRDPEGGENLCALCIENAAVVTSGCYQRYFKIEGKKYCHIIDALTGYPVNEVLSVTIIAPTAVDADAIATSVMLLGADKGLKFIESRPGCEGMIIYKNPLENGKTQTLMTPEFERYVIN